MNTAQGRTPKAKGTRQKAKGTRQKAKGWSAVVVALVTATASSAQPNRIDTVTPSAPDLAAYGPFAIGVRTVQLTDRNRPDILSTKEGEPTARYDRKLTVEVWYPAVAATQPASEYRTIARDPQIPITLIGKAVRDAAPRRDEGPYPLVVVSHGYPGNRFLLSHLAENLASKGFVVASIDHTDSTYDDQKAFASTLYNRPFDQLFVVNEMARIGAARSGTDLSGLVDASRVGLVGYSMGGYGVVNVIGGGYTKDSETKQGGPPNRLLGERAAANPTHRQSIDPRIKAAIAIGPWGMPAGYWDAEGLKGIRTPILFVAGSADEVSGYEKGTRAIFQAATNADRHLLTFLNAGHNAAAPFPAPAETYRESSATTPPFMHYADPVWDTVRMNNILQHFATAYFDLHLKDEHDKKAYFDLVPNGKDGDWKGFKRRTAVGLMLEHLAPGQ